MAELVKSYFPKVKIKYEKRDQLIPERGTLDITKAKKLLSYSPENDLKTGIKKYIKWYSKTFKW